MLKVNILTPSSADSRQLFYELTEELDSLKDLKVVIDDATGEGERGVLNQPEFWIVISSTGIISGMYLMLKDFYDRYHNCEITLSFPDGSSATIKGLTEKEALEKISSHIDQIGLTDE